MYQKEGDYDVRTLGAATRARRWTVLTLLSVAQSRPLAAADANMTTMR